MTGGSLGLRSGSYGSLQQHLQIGVSPSQTIPLSAAVRKPSKMVKEKEKLLHWIFKFAGRKKVGMLFLCAVSAAVFIWVLYIAKGEDAQGVQIQNTGDNNSSYVGFLKSSPVYRDQINNNDITSFGGPPPPPPSSHPLPSPPPPPSPPNLMPPPPAHPCSPTPPLPLPPPAVFLGYALPHGNPCENFTLPPPPADKKRTGPRPCPVCYLPVEDAVALMPEAPSPSPIVTNLNYMYGEILSRSEFGGSDFGGYPSLQQRNDSYDIKESMNVHCGFFKGAKPGHETGFDIGDSDLHEMERCGGIVVASAIFGNYDVIQQPKNISEVAKMNVCFYMFVDEETEAYVKNSSVLDQSQKIGLWRIVVVHNLPYIDARRNGKVPKLLLHRIFPNARYSLWIDGKLELVVDPYQILERFLWRKNATFAISRHYKRFDVFVEAEANKAAGKYDNASIDFQVDFYRREGLTAYSDAKLPITSDVPEGCVIIREHIPISNLFTCLWFNEVDRFTSRDQISFSTVRDKISSKVNWSINMFLDCERRNFVVQGYHKDLLDHMAPPHARNHVPLSPPPPLPPILSPPLPALRPSDEMGLSPPVRKIPQKRGRDRRRYRKVAAGSRDSSSSRKIFV